MSLENPIKKLLWVGLIIFVLANIAQTAFVALAGLWTKNRDVWPENSRVPNIVPDFIEKYGTAQKDNWQRSINSLKRAKKIAEERRDIFDNAREDPDNRYYSEAQNRFVEEKKLANDVELKIKKTKIQSGDKGIPYYAFFSTLIMAVSLIASKRMYRDAKRIFAIKISDLKWKAPYIFFLVIFSATSLFTFSVSSIFTKNKNWIGASSFFICWKAWVTERISNFGVIMIVAIPIAIFWCLTSKDKIPNKEKIVLSSPDGMSGVRAYIAFLHGWSIAGLAIFSLGTVVGFQDYLRSQAKYSPIYFSLTFILFIVLAVLLARMFRSALSIRSLYWEAIQERYKTMKEVIEAGVSPDPTLSFIGENWMSMIAIWGGMLGLAWTVFGLFGLSKIFLSFF